MLSFALFRKIFMLCENYNISLNLFMMKKCRPIQCSSSFLMGGGITFPYLGNDSNCHFLSPSNWRIPDNFSFDCPVYNYCTRMGRGLRPFSLLISHRTSFYLNDTINTDKDHPPDLLMSNTDSFQCRSQQPHLNTNNTVVGLEIQTNI